MEEAKVIIPYFLSIITLYNMFLAGNMHKNAWIVGLVNQFLWLIWIIISSAWGLLPMNIGLWVMYYRNHKKWNKNLSK